jgi:hypothetical protein
MHLAPGIPADRQLDVPACIVAAGPAAQGDVCPDQPQVVGGVVGRGQLLDVPGRLMLTAAPDPARSGRTNPASTSYFRSVSICSCSPVAMV